MAVVEYCDNVNCRLNSKFRCKAPEVEFDAYANCVTSVYEEYDSAAPPENEDMSAPGERSRDVDGESDDKWLKYI